MLRDRLLVGLLLAVLLESYQAWILSPLHAHPSTLSQKRPSTRLQGTGFGGGGSKNKKDIKLKPKQQWDRFLTLKKEERIPVAVRTTGDWLEVGVIRSQGSQYTAVAVAKQRALLAEHAKRLYPLQVSPKDKMEWAFKSSEKWVVVDKIIEGDVAGIEKLIGFEGTPDPSTGYYCFYNEGRMVQGDKDVQSPSRRLE